MAFLRYLDDDGRFQTKTLDSEHFTIGRAASCNLPFESDMISREHLRIDLEKDGRFRAHDLGSRNRTFVNGEIITETMLNGGDVVRVGDRVVEFVDDAVTPVAGDLDFLTPDRTEPPNCEWIKTKAPLALTLSQLEQLAQLTADPPLTARGEDIASAALSQLLLELQADRGLIALRGEKKADIRLIAQRGFSRPPSGSLMPVSQSFALAPQLQGVAGRYPQTAGQINTKLGYAAAALVAPLTFRGEVIGFLYADRPHTKRPFPSAALQLAAAAGAHVGASLGEAARKLARVAPREAMAWMTTIRKVQAALASKVTGSDTFMAAHKRIPGRVRCGDFLDVVHLDEQRCAVVIVDGGGHGVTGLAQGHAIRAALRTALGGDDESLMDPGGMLNAINQMVASSGGRQVVPVLFAGIDMAAGKLAYVNAGMTPPLLMVAPGRLVTLEQSSLVLGVDADYLYDPARVDLPEQFRLVCCTDGLLEATNAGGEALGEQRLHESLLDRDAFTSASAVLDRIMQLWSSHLAGTQPDDDASALVIGYGGAEPSTA